MRSVFEERTAEARQIGGSFATGLEENFQAFTLGDICARIWTKPDKVVAWITGRSDRQARDYLADRVEPPAILIEAIHAAMLRKWRK